VRSEADKDAEFVFPIRLLGARSRTIRHAWGRVCKAAGLRDFRIHDLRHSYASILASSGYSLSVIGKLLGHSNPATTSKYAHLADAALKLATEKAGEIIAGK